MPSTHLFSNPHENLEKVKFYPPFYSRKLRLGEQGHLPKAMGWKHLWSGPAPGPPLATPQGLGEDGCSRPCDAAHCAHRTDIWRHRPLHLLTSPGAVGSPPPSPCSLCISGRLPRGPCAPYQVQQHSQGIPRPLLVLEDLGEGLADERGGTVELHIAPDEQEPCGEPRKHLRVALTQPSWSLQLICATERERLAKDSCSTGWTRTANSLGQFGTLLLGELLRKAAEVTAQ